MKKLLVMIISFITAGFVNAQSNPFEGFSLGVNVSSVGANNKTTFGQGYVPGYTNNGQQSIVPSLEAGYTFSATKDFALGLTATYDLANTKLGEYDNSLTTVNYKLKNHYSINLKPGYVINDSSMIYALVGYNAAKSSITSGFGSSSWNVSGLGAGLGVQTLLNKNIYIKAEVQQINYGSKTLSDGTYSQTEKASTTVGTIGIGYKF